MIRIIVLWIKHHRIINYGELSEWFMVTVLKTVVRQRTGGSNPSLSAAPPADRFNCKSTKVKLRQ